MLTAKKTSARNFLKFLGIMRAQFLFRNKWMKSKVIRVMWNKVCLYNAIKIIKLGHLFVAEFKLSNFLITLLLINHVTSNNMTYIWIIILLFLNTKKYVKLDWNVFCIRSYIFTFFLVLQMMITRCDLWRLECIKSIINLHFVALNVIFIVHSEISIYVDN